jgi:hypothetical protein
MKEVYFDKEKKLLDDESNFCNLVAEKYLNKEIIIKPMFSVPLLHIKMSNWEIKKKKLLELFDESKEWLVNRDSVFTTYELERHRKNKSQEQILQRQEWEKQFANIIDQIFYEERKIIYECFGNPENFPNKMAEINYAWFQEQKKGMFHAPHTHGNAPSSLGSVCFIEFDERVHTPTEFICPFLNNLEYNRKEVYVEKNISSGSLIVFPSNIFHYTLPSQDEKSRIIVSLNMTV